jgi:hypothetical protein
VRYLKSQHNHTDYKAKENNIPVYMCVRARACVGVCVCVCTCVGRMQLSNFVNVLRETRGHSC